MTKDKYLSKLADQYKSYEQLYRKLVAGSNDAINISKRAIFAFHRGDASDGKKLLDEAGRILTEFESDFKKVQALRFEGSYRAAVEEFIEANLFLQFLNKEPISQIIGFESFEAESYLGGLSDLTGELVRYAVGRATAGDTDEVRRAGKRVDEVMAFLINLDLTGYLRNKYDQAKNSLRRMEEIMYDVALRR